MRRWTRSMPFEEEDGPWVGDVGLDGGFDEVEEVPGSPILLPTIFKCAEKLNLNK